MKVVTLFKYILLLLFCVSIVATPLSCDYAAKNGPEWIRKPNPSKCATSIATAALATTFGLYASLMVIGAFACIESISKDEKNEKRES